MESIRSCLLILVIITTGAHATDLGHGIGLQQSGDLAGATAIFEALATADRDDAVAAYQLGYTYFLSGDLDRAVKWLNEAIDRDDTESLYFQRLGEAYGSHAGQAGMFKAMRLSGKIRRSFEQAVALDPDNLDARDGLIVFYLNAPAIAGGGTGKALAQAEELARRDARRGHLAHAAIYSSQEEFGEAEREYRAAIELAPGEGDGYLALGIFLTGRERFDEAIGVYDARLATHSDDMQIRYQVGRTASISGTFLEQGQAAMESYLLYRPGPGEPGLAWANYRLGLIFQHQERAAAAAAAFRKALEIDPEHEQARAALDDLDDR